MCIINNSSVLSEQSHKNWQILASIKKDLLRSKSNQDWEEILIKMASDILNHPELSQKIAKVARMFIKKSFSLKRTRSGICIFKPQARLKYIDDVFSAFLELEHATDYSKIKYLCQKIMLSQGLAKELESNGIVPSRFILRDLKNAKQTNMLDSFMK